MIYTAKMHVEFWEILLVFELKASGGVPFSVTLKTSIGQECSLGTFYLNFCWRTFSFKLESYSL